MEEIWKDITGYEGLYQVSNLGRVRNVKSFKILKPSYGVDGYLQLCLTKGSKKSTKKIHRLVAQAFMENINNYETIDHIDCNKTNNNVNNLEWCTREENISGKRNTASGYIWKLAK